MPTDEITVAIIDALADPSLPATQHVFRLILRKVDIIEDLRRAIESHPSFKRHSSLYELAINATLVDKTLRARVWHKRTVDNEGREIWESHQLQIEKITDTSRQIDTLPVYRPDGAREVVLL